MVDHENNLGNFLSWCDTNGLQLSKKVKVSLEGSCHRFGMIAVDDIDKGESLFEIPRSLLLTPETSSISGILETLANDGQFALENRSGWTPLLVALMYEYTDPSSHWRPYLNLIPDINVLDQPMFWGRHERQKELKGTGILEDVEHDVQKIEEEYKCIAWPFMNKHKQYFSESHHTLDLYKHMAAFVMAYSFTENSSDEDDDSDSENAALTGPAMVPMADILNHISNNNAHLEFGDEKLTMVAVQDISKGEEIFNTYGKLANCDLLKSYGFIECELPNKYDMADIPLVTFHKVMKENLSSTETQLLNAKFEFGNELDVFSDGDLFQFGRDGCFESSPDLYFFLRILHLSGTQFKELLQQLIQPQRTKTFDDIVPLLNLTDEKTKKNVSQRILKLVLKAERESPGKKRAMNEGKSQRMNKKQKLEIGNFNHELEDFKVKNKFDRNFSPNNYCSDDITSGLNGRSESCNVKCHSKTKLIPAVESKDKPDGRIRLKERPEEQEISYCSKNNSDENNEDFTVDNNDKVDVDDHDCDDYDDGIEEQSEEEEENESEEILTYELLSQWPIGWRKTLASVAQFCIQERFGGANMDKDISEDSRLSNRQLSALRIRRGQKYIFQQICELGDKTVLP
ncbi:N-lysine methyltransferase setd6-like isoform X1 [Acropora palmata]|uniref:N-lysine methyltransferase setd6-like isoform X1 n=1 Tax=Acropora palmata TaxID=6131 RepID=UPI003DA08A2D